MRIYLGGHLNFYHPDKDRWLAVQLERSTPLTDILEDAGIPLNEVQLVSLNGEVVDLGDAILSEGDEVKVFSAVGGG
jgi:sulfur carrier protein ThiS